MTTSPTPSARPRLDARTTAWLMQQRERNHELDIEVARLRGQLEASERIERASQRYADKVEAKLDEARQRESTLARALGYAEGQRDRLAHQLKAARTRRVPRIRAVE